MSEEKDLNSKPNGTGKPASKQDEQWQPVTLHPNQGSHGEYEPTVQISPVKVQEAMADAET